MLFSCSDKNTLAKVTYRRRVYLGLWFQKDGESIMMEAWQQGAGMVAGGC